MDDRGPEEAVVMSFWGVKMTLGGCDTLVDGAIIDISEAEIGIPQVAP